jgi:hypothetical protein
MYYVYDYNDKYVNAFADRADASKWAANAARQWGINGAPRPVSYSVRYNGTGELVARFVSIPGSAEVISA